MSKIIKVSHGDTSYLAGFNEQTGLAKWVADPASGREYPEGMARAMVADGVGLRAGKFESIKVESPSRKIAYGGVEWELKGDAWSSGDFTLCESACSGRWIVRSRAHGETYGFDAGDAETALHKCSQLIKFFGAPRV